MHEKMGHYLPYREASENHPNKIKLNLTQFIIIIDLKSIYHYIWPQLYIEYVPEGN